MIDIRHLNQFYGGSHILWDIDLNISAGSRCCLMGRNGMGKSTLLRSLMGLESIRSGEMLFDGENLAPLPAEARARMGIGYVPQGREIFSTLTVEDNLRTALVANPGDTTAALERIYEIFPVLKRMYKRRGGDLSGGQQQQLAIGRALLLNPRMLILDEPCEGIQPNIVHDIGDLLIRLNEELQLTVLLVEQKLPFARRVATDFHILENGRVVASNKIAGLTDELVQKHLTV